MLDTTNGVRLRVRKFKHTALALSLIACFAAGLGWAETAVPGGVYVWELPTGTSAVTFNDKPVMLNSGAAFVGLPITMKPGEASLEYRVGGAIHKHTFSVNDKSYTEQHITLANKAMVNPPEETLARIRAESVRQRALYNSFSTPVALSEGFALPLQGVTTSLFGHRRFFNGEPRSPHSGLDIAADTGTPIHAAGNGTVTLADELYFNGNTLFIDHGQGLITMYCHMSKLLAAQGDEVRQGQTIGLVGATGRVTGPHLHWSVSLNGARVDPTAFMQALNARQ
jgi:murein DD-endopeptidase MepM/ murein hydrolase activator NlpD